MSSSPHIGFVPRNVARLLRTRFGKRSRVRLDDRRPCLPYPIPHAGPLLEIMRGNGRKTRDEALAGHSSETRRLRPQTPSFIKSNLLAARTRPADDREKVHG
ncbi:hypothetical protein C1D09_009365 [Mesorhizobium intechi]|uniref:hypothetical protein n=1 Tax=Mesorhizobium intechi TaxID=537601 RepID=UPI000CB2E7C4|nr:hypothetical protein [Mesorhizobium intechi]TSE12283.1 hypothetical protein C1D09_009365 [Mesorhizobium intechi]